MTMRRDWVPNEYDAEAVAWALDHFSDITLEHWQSAEEHGLDPRQIMACRNLAEVSRWFIDQGLERGAGHPISQQPTMTRATMAGGDAASPDAWTQALAECRPFQQYCTALTYLSIHRTMTFVFGRTLPPAPPADWGEFIRQPLLTESGRMLCDVSAQIANCQDWRISEETEAYLRRFTTDCLRLRAEAWDPVARTLWEGGWRQRDIANPIAHVRVTVCNRERWGSDDRILDPRSPDGMEATANDGGRPRSLDLRQTPTADPFGATLPDRFLEDSLADIENRLAIRQIMEQVAASPEVATELALARYEADVMREHAPAALGRTPQQVNAAHRDLQRKARRLRDELAG